jgi:hypothetical protein
VPPATADVPVRPRRPRRPGAGRVVGHTGLTVAGYHSTFVIGLVVPLTAGAAVFGWRGLASVGILLATVLAGTLLWRRVAARGHPLRPSQLLRMGLLLALMLPAGLLANRPVPVSRATWPVLPAAGLLLVVVCWAVGPGGGGRLNPVLFAYLALAALCPQAMSTRTVLQRDHLVLGDVLRTTPAVPADGRATPDPWRLRPLVPDADAVAVPSTADALLAFTRGRGPPAIDSVDAFLRERVPPLEDVVLGAVPGPIGTTSAVAVIFGGLFLVYRGLIDFRVPLLIVASAWVAVIVLPVGLPTVGGGHAWRWVAGASPAVGWASAVTLANYEVLASPLLFTAFFLAGSPSVRPLGGSARSLYALFVGVAAAALQMYVSVSLGSYVAVMAAGAVASNLDRWLTPRPLV